MLLTIGYDKAGLFSHLFRVIEWMYYAEENENINIYVNFQGFYNSSINTFEYLFINNQEYERQEREKDPIQYNILDFPYRSPFSLTNFSLYNGINCTKSSNYIYADVNVYKNPKQFLIYRKNCYPIINKFFRPVPHIQDAINKTVFQMDQNYKIGFHVRCIDHYNGLNISSEDFIDKICTEITNVMINKNLNTMFIATLCEPIINNLKLKFNVIYNQYQRCSSAKGDWSDYNNTSDLKAVEDCLIDTYCLGSCDEIYCGSSNVTIFAACINPEMKINLLPLLSHYDGW